MRTMNLPEKPVVTGGYYLDAVDKVSRYVHPDRRAYVRKPWEMDGDVWTGTDFHAGTRKKAKRAANRIMRHRVRLDLRINEW